MQFQPRVANIIERSRNCLVVTLFLLALSACDRDRSSDKQTNIDPNDQVLEQELVDEQQVDEDKNQQSSQSEQPADIVENLGFAGIEDDTKQQQAPEEEAPLFCLNSLGSDYELENVCKKVSKRLASVSYELSLIHI